MGIMMSFIIWSHRRHAVFVFRSKLSHNLPEMLQYYHFKVKVLCLLLCRSQWSRFATLPIIGEHDSVMEHAVRPRKRKSSATRKRGLLRVAIFTAPYLSGSCRVDMHRTSRTKLAPLKCGENTSRDERCFPYSQPLHSNKAIPQAQP